MDASKTAETMDRMSAQFFPYLIPGRSIVVQQHFLWWQQPWIAVQMTLLTDYFEPVVHVPRDSVSFLCRKAVPRELLEELEVATMTDAQVMTALPDMKQAVKLLRIDDAPSLRPCARQSWGAKGVPVRQKALSAAARHDLGDSGVFRS